MAYPVSTPPSAVKPVGQKVAGSAIAAACLYIAGCYLPLVSSSGESARLCDGDGAVWLWVVPSVIAIAASVVALTGKAVAGALAAGVVTGLAGMTTFQLIFTRKVYADAGVSKGVGFWALALAVSTAVGAAVPLLTTRTAGERRCEQLPSMLGAAAFIGVPAAVLLPADGFSPLSDMDDGLLKFGVVVWALLSPALAMALVASRRQSGVAFGAGAAVGHLGFTMMVLQSGVEGGFGGGVGAGHTALYHWTAVAALGLTVTALVMSLTAAPAAAAGPVVAQGQWAADPYGRHQYRLWDGTRWTANVSDHGVVGLDEPVVAPPPPTIAQTTIPTVDPPTIPRSQWRPPNG